MGGSITFFLCVSLSKFPWNTYNKGIGESLYLLLLFLSFLITKPETDNTKKRNSILMMQNQMLQKTCGKVASVINHRNQIWWVFTERQVQNIHAAFLFWFLQTATLKASYAWAGTEWSAPNQSLHWNTARKSCTFSELWILGSFLFMHHTCEHINSFPLCKIVGF